MIKQQYIDYFKLFKIYDLKKLQKTGQVKIVQDRILMRKILSVEGTVSTENYTTFICSQYPNIHFKQQYLYLQAFCEPGKSFNFQVTYFLSNKQKKIICSTMYKDDFKRKSDHLSHFKLKIPTQKWTILAIDLYSLVNWDQTFKNDQDLRLVFRISNIEIRANSKVRGMFQSDVLYGPHNLPKDMQLPLRGNESFFDKYSFVVTGLNLTEQVKCQIQKFKQKDIEQNNVPNFQGITNLSSNSLNKEKNKRSESLRKSIKQDEKKNLSKSKPQKVQETIKDHKKPPKSNPKTQRQKQKPQKNQKIEEIDFIDDDQDLIEEQILQPPKPAASLNMKIQAIEAISLVYDNIVSCESFLTEPVRVQTHKKITNIYRGRVGKVLTSYADGSVCVWDTIRKQSLFYFRSQLQQIKCLLMDYEGNIVIVGLDKLKRQVIEIVSEGAIIFKQISNFNIKSIKFISEESFELGLMSIGYENIRLWTISPNNNIINGYSVYLGKMSRNVTYNESCIVQTVAGSYGFVCDSQGYVTKININQKKMEGVVRVDTCGIDHIKLIKYLNHEQKILVANQKGTIKLLSCTSMESQLEYPLQNRIKSLFLKQNPKHDDIPNLLLQSYNKTLAELDLVDSTFHFLIRSHYQQVTHISYEKTANKISSLEEDKIITAGSDSTMRIWKLIAVSEQERVLKQEYEFLINGETITHICSVSGSKQNGEFVYIITDTNKIRKISSSNYQIVKEKTVPSSTRVVSFSINKQGKILLIVTLENIFIMDSELQAIQFKDLSEQNGNKKIKNQSINCLSGFNNHNKAFFFQNPFNQCIEFYQLKDITEPTFHIPSSSEDKILCLEWDSQHIHSITEDQYRLYENNSLIRSIPLVCDHQRQNKGNSQFTYITMNYPLVCKSYSLKNTSQDFLSIQVLNKSGLNQTIKMPETINQIKVSKPVKNPQDQTGSDWIGEIICSGAQSFGLYFIKYNILNLPDLLTFQDNLIEFDKRNVSFMDSEYKQTKIKKINFQGSNISFIGNPNAQNALDISFSDNATIISGFKYNNNTQIPSKTKQKAINPPKQLKKLYEEEEKVFEQCKNAIFGNYFDKPSNYKQQEQFQEDQQHQIVQNEQPPQNGRIKMKMFFGVDVKQSLIDDSLGQTKKIKNERLNELGKFYWNAGLNLVSLLTNLQKTLLIHEFTQPQVTQKLLHLYTRPSSICWSSGSQSQKKMQYFVVCFNSIIKLYNAGTKMSYIRSIEIDLLIKEKHIIFSSFITNCNSFLVVLSYKLQDPKDLNDFKEKVYKAGQNKLYIFVIELSTGKIVSSSYRELKYTKKTKSRFDYEKMIRETYSLCVNSYSSNKQLQFILKGSNQLSFYRVTSMLTLQTLQVEEINDLTKEKTQALTTICYVKIEGDVYMLVGTQNGSLIILDSRSGAIVLVLMNLISEPISSIQFIPEQIVQGQLHSYSKLIFFASDTNVIRIIQLENGLNTLIRQVENSSTTISGNQSFSSHNREQKSLMRMINLDSEVTSVSHMNNLSQQLVLTKSSTLWLVDYSDCCSIKILSPHSSFINEACLLAHKISQNENKNRRLFISCSEDGYVKVSQSCKLEQLIEIYKPRKKALSLQVQGNYTVCAFNDEVYFYESLEKDISNLNYLGSLHFQNQFIVKIKNIPFSDNYYILTQHKIYIIYVKRKQSHNITKSQLSINSHSRSFTNQSLKNPIDQSQISKSSKNLNYVGKVQIEIQIQEITCFSIDQKSSFNPRSLWLQINPFKLYDQFCIGFQGGKVQTWERKCLKRTLNPLQELSAVQQLSYYLIDVYNKKEVLQPNVQFISQRQYMISLSELNKLEIRNYKDHSIVKQISFSNESLQGIKTFKYFILKNEKSQHQQVNKTYNQYQKQNQLYFNPLNSLKNGPLIIIGDNHGYFNICDINGLVIQKSKVFNSPIDSIQLINEEISQNVAFSVFLKSSHFISILQIFY